MPDPPDLENNSFSKLGMKNLNNYINDKLVKEDTGENAENVEEMLVNVDQIPSSSWNTVLCSLFLSRMMEVDHQKDIQAGKCAGHQLGPQ